MRVNRAFWWARAQAASVQLFCHLVCGEKPLAQAGRDLPLNAWKGEVPNCRLVRAAGKQPWPSASPGQGGGKAAFDASAPVEW